MAELLIDAKVTGINQVKDLDKAVKNVEKSTKGLHKEIMTWRTAMTLAGAAIGATVYAGAKWLTKQEEINGALVKTNDLTGDLSDAFGAMSGTILEQTGLWDAYKTVLEATTDVLDGLTIAMGGVSQAEREYAAWKREEDEYLATTSAEIKKDQIKAADKLALTISEGYSNAREWRQSGVQEANERAAEDEAIANERLADSLAAVMSIREQFTNYASGRNPDAQAWQSTWEGDQKTEENTDATEANTGSLKDVERAIRDQTTYTNRTTTSGYQSGGDQGSGNYAPTSYQRNPYNAGSGMYASGWSGRVATPQWYGARTFRGTMAGVAGGGGDTSSFGGALQSGSSVMEAFAGLEDVAEVTEEVVRSLEDLEEELSTWQLFLYNSIDILDQVNSGLKDMASTLEGISNALGLDWVARAREALYGGTSQSLGYEEAKANAEAAWDIYQTDTWNEEYLATYNDRMDDMIGTLEDFNDTTKYISSQEQAWAKAVALRQVSEFQDVQDIQKADTDAQIALLEELIALSTIQNENSKAANEILDGVKAATYGVIDESARTTASTDIVQEKIEKNFLEVYYGRLATNLVQDAVDDVTLATNKVKTVSDTISARTSTILNSNDAIQYNTALTVEATSDPYDGIGQPLYQTGGYTGNGGVNQVAGLVHGQEYVVNAQTTADLGLNGSGGVFQQMNNKLDLLYNLYEINKTTKRSLAVQSDTRSVLETNTNAAT